MLRLGLQKGADGSWYLLVVALIVGGDYFAQTDL